MTFYVADPGKGFVRYSLEEFKSHWISIRSNGEEKGFEMFLEPTPTFYSHKEDGEGEKNKNLRSFRFLFGYVRKSSAISDRSSYAWLWAVCCSSSCRSSPSLSST